MGTSLDLNKLLETLFLIHISARINNFRGVQVTVTHCFLAYIFFVREEVQIAFQLLYMLLYIYEIDIYLGPSSKSNFFVKEKLAF